MKRKKGNVRVEDNDFSLVDDRCLAHYCLPGSREASSVQQILTNALKRNDFQHLHGLICFRVGICEIEGKKEERIYLLSTDTRQFTHIDAKHQWDEAISKARKAKSEQGQPKRRRREQPRIFTSNVYGNVYGGMNVQPLPQGEQQGGNPMPTEEVMPPRPQQQPAVRMGEGTIFSGDGTPEEFRVQYHGQPLEPTPASPWGKKICEGERITLSQSSQGEVAPPLFMEPDPMAKPTTLKSFPLTQDGYWKQFVLAPPMREQGGHSK